MAFAYMANSLAKGHEMALWLSIRLALGVGIGAMYNKVAIRIVIGVILGDALALIERTKR